MSSVDDLTNAAHEHLKVVKKMHPDGRAATPTKDMLDSTMGRGSKLKYDFWDNLGVRPG